MEIIKYQNKHRKLWNDFVRKAKNSHFFFEREYMEYHSDKFDDFSLLVFDDNNKLISMLPANIEGDTLYSHQGLTFGGFLISDKIKTQTILNIFDALNTFAKINSISKLIYKCIPYIYHKKPSEEDRYALFRSDAKLIQRDVSSTINLQNKTNYQEQRKRAIKKAIKNHLIIEESLDFESFWKILEKTLRSRHKVKPTHTLDEIMKLANLFPNNIKLFLAKKGSIVFGGAVIFENEQIVHTQYLANSIEGKKVGALDLAIDSLINDIYPHKKYFDFGISNEEGGRYLNTGLISQKEGFGGRAVVHDIYRIEIR